MALTRRALLEHIGRVGGSAPLTWRWKCWGWRFRRLPEPRISNFLPQVGLAR